MRDLASANAYSGPYDAVIAMGPESGALSLLAAQAGAFGDAHLYLAEAPESLSHRLNRGLAPYWSVLIPELLKITDLDHVAQELHSQGKLTVVNGGSSLGVPSAPLQDPVSNRADAVARVIEVYSQKACMVKVPVLSVKGPTP